VHRVATCSTPSAPPERRDIGYCAQRIAARLDLGACWFEPFPFDQLLPRVEPGAIVLPADEPGARPYSRWQPSDGIELPVRAGDLTLGRFVLVSTRPTCGVALDSSARADAIAIARSAAGELANEWGVEAMQLTAEKGMCP
jgi:hypothetical protein